MLVFPGARAPGSTSSGLLPVWCFLISVPLSLTHGPRLPTCLSVWVSKPLSVSVCLSLFGLWVSPPLHSLTKHLPSADKTRAMPSFPLGVWKCEYHHMRQELRCSCCPSALGSISCCLPHWEEREECRNRNEGGGWAGSVLSVGGELH